jgi:hypothetical protein
VEGRLSDERSRKLRVLVDAYDSGLAIPLTTVARAALPLALARTAGLHRRGRLGGGCPQSGGGDSGGSRVGACARARTWALVGDVRLMRLGLF